MSRLPFLLLLLAACSVQAGAYRWVDADGNVVYSQSPPPSGEATPIKPPPPPAVSPEEARRKVQEQGEKLDAYLEDRGLAKQKAQEDKARRDLEAANCQAARGNLAKLEAAAGRLVGLPDGTYMRLPEEDRQARMQEAREQIQKFCK